MSQFSEYVRELARTSGVFDSFSDGFYDIAIFVDGQRITLATVQGLTAAYYIVGGSHPIVEFMIEEYLRGKESERF